MKNLPLVLLLIFSVLQLHAQTPPGQTPPAKRPTLRNRPLGELNTNGPAMQPRLPLAGQPNTPEAPGSAAQGASPDAVTTQGNAAGSTPFSNASGAPSGANLTKAQLDEVVPAGTINFQGVELNVVLTIYAQYVGRTLIRGTLPDAKIILKTETPLTKSEVIQALQAVLALNGISVIPVGEKFVKVVPSDQANAAGAEIDHSGATNLPNMGSYVTHITQLKYVKPSLMMPLIAPFSKLQNSIFAIDDNGILVIRDYAENVKRMLEMIAQIDVSVPAEYISEVIPIRYSKVSEIAAALTSLGGGGGGSAVSIGSSSGSSTISGLGNRGGGGMGSMGGSMGSMGGATSGGLGGSTTGAFGSRTGISGGGAANPNGTPTGGSTFAQRLNNIINRASSPTGAGGGGGGGQDQIQLFGQTKIIPNESTGSLLIYATRADMEVIKGIISKLDVPPPQVLIEAIIMDVTIGHNFNFGMSVAQNPTTLSPGGSVLGGGGMNNGNSFMKFIQSVTTTTNAMGVVTSQTSGVTGSGGTNAIFGNNLAGGASYFANLGPTWDVAVAAAQSDNHASIIQRPRIQTSQAKPAQFFVGETKPYVTSTYSGYSGGYGGSSYSQLSVGVELDVTPFINPDGLVVMDIQQEIDDFNGTTSIAGVGDVPNTIKRTINAEIAVKDRDTVMLGGFIKSDKSHSQSGVPFLSDIPILGNLFKQRTDSKGRQELIVLIRPTVLQTPELAAKHTKVEEQRLPGISAAAAEDSEYERKLIDAQRKREQKKFGKTKQYDGFFNPSPDSDETNNPSAVPLTAPVAAPAAKAEAAAVPVQPLTEKEAQEKSRAALEQKLKELDSATPPH